MKEPQSDTSYLNPRILKINVGFLLAESSGYSRVMPLEIEQRLRISEDLMVEKLMGELRLTRTSQGILVQGFLETLLLDQCSRCLTDVPISLSFTLEELFGLSPHPNNQFLVGDDNILDLAPLLREEIFTSMPRKSFCQPDCKGLCPKCGINLNENTCNCSLERVDSRWEALLALQAKLNQDEV